MIKEFINIAQILIPNWEYFKFGRLVFMILLVSFASRENHWKHTKS